MAYVPVPKDLNAVKTKVMFNLTKRQILCFGGGALIGVPLFFLLKGHIGSSAAALCMMLVMLPFFLVTPAGKAHFLKIAEKIRVWEPREVAEGKDASEQAVFAACV